MSASLLADIRSKVLQAYRGGDDERAAELAAWLAGLEFEDEAASDARGQRHVVLAHLQRFAVLADHGAELLGVGAG